MNSPASTAGTRVIPHKETVPGVRQYLVRSNTLPPAQYTNCFLLGDAGAPRVLVDPSPHSAAELETLLDTLADETIDEVFLTHQHPDHREYADEIARRRGVPLSMSPATQERLNYVAPRLLRGIDVVLRDEGEVLTCVQGQRIHILAVPGHDAGQLALLAEDRRWCLAGDLFQAIGSVVVAAPDGNMRAYYASLERLIELAPAQTYPSHGDAQPGVAALQQVLAHRRKREAQILALVEAGQDLDGMIAALYASLDARLAPLARMSIESHLQKLREDGAIA